jgi:transposase
MLKVFAALMFLGFCAIYFSPAHAEGGCPPGQYPRQGQGWHTCVPIPGADQGNTQAVQNAGHWETRWGAVATFEPTGVLGAVTGLRTKEEAQEAAMNDCRAKGGTSCKLEVAYQNGCAALAGSDSGYVVTSDADTSKAESSALATCSKAGNANCHVFYSACSNAVLIP